MEARSVTHSVAVVVDREFGDALRELASRVPVWVCDTPTNRRIAEAHRLARPHPSNQRGLTTFRVTDRATAQQMLLEVMDMVDLHHAEWECLEIYGVGPTRRIRDALAELGVSELERTSYGFRCLRRPRTP